MKDNKCPITTAADLVGDTSTLMIIKNLLDGPKRYSEIKKQVDMVSEATLSTRLKYLVEKDIIERTQYQTIPVKVEYKIKRCSKTLKKIINSLSEFGKEIEVYNLDNKVDQKQGS
jgi:DNA-binding HxlR family transcriptional regulator